MQYTSQAQVKIRVYQHTEMRSKMADLNELNEKVEQIKADIREQLEKIENTKGVYEYKKTILDKNGIIGGLMKQMGSVPKEEKADFGKKVNELKNWASEHFDELNTKKRKRDGAALRE